GHDAHQGEPLHDAESEGRIYAAAQHHGQNAGLKLAIGEADGIGGRGTAAGHDLAGTAEAETHTDLTGHGSHGAAGNTEKADLLDLPGMVQPVLLFAEIHRPAAGAQQHADLALFIHAHGGKSGRIKAGGLQSFGRRRNSHGNGARDVLAFVGVYPGKLVEVFEFATDVYRQFRRIKARDAGYAAFAGQQCPAKFNITQTIWTQRTKASYNNAKRHWDIVQRVPGKISLCDKKMTIARAVAGCQLPVASKKRELNRREQGTQRLALNSS